MDRLLHEAVMISMSASMNSKSEHVGYKIKRIQVEKNEWKSLKELELADKVVKIEETAMMKIKDRSNKTPSTDTSNICRKREMDMSSAVEPYPIAKRTRKPSLPAKPASKPAQQP